MHKGLTNGTRTRSATFTGSNATHTPWSTSLWKKSPWWVTLPLLRFKRPLHHFNASREEDSTYPCQDLHLIRRLRTTPCFSYTTGTKCAVSRKRPMPVTLRLNLFDRQAGYYYINEASLWWMAGSGIAPASRRLQRRANLSQLSSLGFEKVVQDGNAPPSTGYQPAALLLSYRTRMNRGTSAWTRTKLARLNRPAAHLVHSEVSKKVGPGGIAPLVDFRLLY